MIAGVVKQACNQHHISGHSAVGAPFQVDAEKHRQRSAHIEAISLERGAHLVRVQARLAPAAAAHRVAAETTPPDVDERPAAAPALRFEQKPLYRPAVGQNHIAEILCLHPGGQRLETRRKEGDAGIAAEQGLGVEVKRRTRPAAPEHRALSAEAHKLVAIAETGHIALHIGLTHGDLD